MGRTLARSARYVTAWLVAGAALALLLLANSISDYLFVSRILTVQQVRHELGRYVVALEQKLRRPAAPGLLPLELPAEGTDDAIDEPLWVEIRRSDGTVLARRGSQGPRLFSTDEESAHFRGREPLYRIVPAGAGEVVVEAFPVYGSGLAALPPPSTPGSPLGRRSPLVVEIAAPLVLKDASVVWRIRRDLAINTTAALALLAAVLAAGAGLRSYARGRRLELQVEVARQVQSELLPSRSEAWESVHLASTYRPAEEVSGDFYDVFRAGEGRVAIVMGDVSGKGVPAALVMGVIHGAVRSSRWPESAVAHERESARLNLLLCENASGSRYASMFWCYYDPPTRVLSYVNAGHCPPLLVSGRDHATSIVRLEAGGPVLGILPAARYEQARCAVRSGDVLVLYSDGLTEATSPAGEEYGEGRLRDLLSSMGPGGPEDVRDAILASARAFAGPAPPRDDLTLVVAQFA
jgi:serine phosphatase RsbU (regulator of sigma subunit)